LKVGGETIFNLIKMNEYDVDANERPGRIHKITGVKILENPFSDLKIRSKSEKEEKIGKRKLKEEKIEQIQPKRNTALLSFGDEMDEYEEEASKFQLKGKSAHDVLVDDISLSKQAAVGPEEINHRGENSKKVDVDDKEV